MTARKGSWQPERKTRQRPITIPTVTPYMPPAIPPELVDSIQRMAYDIGLVIAEIVQGFTPALQEVVNAAVQIRQTLEQNVHT